MIHDLACGSGSMGRWLAPLLPGPQRWVLHDRDADLLALAAAGPARRRRSHRDPRVRHHAARPRRPRRRDLITASALLDLLTRDELAALIQACAGAGCPVLLTLSVNGRVQLLPADPLDARVAAAFNAHQRRRTPRGRLLGPDAVEAAVEGSAGWGPRSSSARARGGSAPPRATSPSSGSTGWIDAACEQEPALVPDADLYRRRRLREAAAGALAVTVGHADLLVLP